jgi:hypothetical protein
MSNKFKVIPKGLTAKEKYDTVNNNLLLKEGRDFFVTIEELDTLLKNKPVVPAKRKELSGKDYGALTDVEKKSYNEKVKKYNREVAEYEKKEKDYRAKLKPYENLNWAWRLAGLKLAPDEINHNESFSKGIQEILSQGQKKVKFPKLLEGGGIAWLEVWPEGQKATAKIGTGLCVQAEGIPKIIRTKWTDFDYNPLDDVTLGFMSEVILHVYATGMYGQDIEVHLIDRDLFDPNNELEISDAANPVSDKNFFTHQVDILKIKEIDTVGNGVTDILLKTEQSYPSKVVESEQYVQKIEIQVLIEKGWQNTDGNNLKIFPAIKSLKTGDYFKDFQRNYLNVSSKSEKREVVAEITNKAVMVGAVETNVANFLPCRFDTAKLDDTVVFDSGNIYHRGKNTLDIEVIAGKKESHLIDFAFRTKECEHKPEKHTNKELVILDIPKDYELKIDASSEAEHKVKKEEKVLVKSESSGSTSFMGVKNTQKAAVASEKGIVTIRQKQIEFDTFYNYDIPQDANALITFYKAMQYFWLPNLSPDKIKYIKAVASTCAFKENINIAIYPDIKWTLKFGFNVKKEDIEKLNRNGGTFAPLKTFEDKAKEADEADFKYNKNNTREVNRENRKRKKTLDKTIKEYTKAYDLKPKAKEAAPEEKGTSFQKLLEILKRITVSLEEEHYGGDIKNELTEEFVKQFYEQIDPIIELAGSALGIVEGDFDEKGYTPEQEKSIDGLMAKLKRKPVEYEMLYPKLSFAGSWFYEQIDAKKYPELSGRQGLGVDLIFKAAPLIGVSIKWDLLELLCRRHPIAYAILKAIDSLLYVLGDDESAIKCDFTVSGQVDTTIDLQLNCLAGFKDFNVKGKNAIAAKIELKINLNNSYRVMKYEVIAKRGFGTSAEIGLGIFDLYGIDNSGIYGQKILEFEGVKISYSATGELNLNKKNGNKKKSLLTVGGSIDGEIVLLNQKIETPKIYFNKIIS